MDDRKTYTPAEREARNRDAFCWKNGDLLFLDSNTHEWLGGEEFLRRGHGNNGQSSSDEELDAYYAQVAKEKKGWTPEECDKRNEDAFVWKEGDIEILNAGDPGGDEDFEIVVPEEQPKTR